MRVAVVDDSAEENLHLRRCLAQFSREFSLSIEVRAYTSAQEFLQEYRHDQDLLILDIDMPGLSGMDAAKQLRAAGDPVTLMFVTNMPQYALEGFAVDAVDYCLKPVDYPAFRLKLQKALRYVRLAEDESLDLKTVDGYRQVHISNITYVESQLHYVLYHTPEGILKCRATLSEVEQVLTGKPFARASASFLVNLRHVQSMQGDVLRVAGEEIRISRGKKKAFVSAFTRYMGGI